MIFYATPPYHRKKIVFQSSLMGQANSSLFKALTFEECNYSLTKRGLRGSYKLFWEFEEAQNDCKLLFHCKRQDELSSFQLMLQKQFVKFHIITTLVCVSQLTPTRVTLIILLFWCFSTSIHFHSHFHIWNSNKRFNWLIWRTFLD